MAKHHIRPLEKGEKKGHHGEENTSPPLWHTNSTSLPGKYITHKEEKSTHRISLKTRGRGEGGEGEYHGGYLICPVDAGGGNRGFM